MSKELNIEAQTRFGEAVNTGNLDALRSLVAPAVVDHDPGPTQGPGAQGYIDLFSEMRAGFPEAKAAVKACLRVAVVLTWQPAPPTASISLS